MMNARQASLTIMYNGVDITSDLSASIMDFSYTDAVPGELDDLQLTVEDRERLWQGSWSPAEGDYIEAVIEVRDWRKSGESTRLPCGRFYIDSVVCSGGSEGDTVTIQAVSLPLDSTVRQERRTMNWENTSLWDIAGEVAAGAGLELHFYVEDNPSYERQDQTDQSDLGFLVGLAQGEGVAAKITGGQLILFDEALFEEKAPALTLTRGEDHILSFSFEWSATNAAFRAAEVTYTKASEDKTFTASYSPPGAPETGPVLQVREAVDSEGEALRIARKRLRERNKQFGKASLTLMGDVRMAAGLTIAVSGWGRYDGKYIVESAAHRIGGGGYTTDIQIRRVLGW
jgi:uncharacterized protein